MMSLWLFPVLCGFKGLQIFNITSTILSFGCRPALSAGESSSTALMYWPGRARSLCRLKPYPLDPRWITQRRGRSSARSSCRTKHTCWWSERQERSNGSEPQGGKTITKYLHHGCRLREDKGHEDDGELLWLVYHEYKAEGEHAGVCCCMLLCCVPCFQQSGLNFSGGFSAHVIPSARQEGKGVCDWRSVGKVSGVFAKGALRKRDRFRSGSEEDNGSWALTSDRLCYPCLDQSCSGMAGRVGAVLSSRKKPPAWSQSLPSAGGMKQVLSLELGGLNGFVIKEDEAKIMSEILESRRSLSPWSHLTWRSLP